MSYPPLSGYGSYYDIPANPSSQATYGSGRQVPSSGVYGQQYQEDGRNTNYSSSGYEWAGQSQSGYGRGQHQSYGNDSWKNNGDHSRSYDSRREASSYATQAAAGTTSQPYYGSSATSTSGQNMIGLNNLAYASGLDTQRSDSRNQQRPASRPHYSTTSSAANKPVQSSMQNLPQQQYSSTSNTQYANSDTTGNALAMSAIATASAAQALAGAVSRKPQQLGQSQSRTSPAMSNGASAQSIVQRSNSPHTNVGHTQNQPRAPSSQSRGVQSRSSNTQAQSPKAVDTRSIPNPASVGKAQQKYMANASKQSSASQSNSISNLVSTTERTQRTSQTPTEPMPAYIDPTQVFNPYHKEHERRRRDALEETRRKEAQAVAAATALAEEREKENAAQANAAKQKKAVSDKGTAVTSVRATSPADDGMAAEMRFMMEKRKDFRSKDPALFQKLWEDMRKGGSGSIPTAQSPSSQVVQQKVPAQQVPAAPLPAIPKPKARPPKATAPIGINATPGGSVPAANGYRVVTEDNEEGLPDLGRFPAERRLRHPYHVQPRETKKPAGSALPSPQAAVSGGPGLFMPTPPQPGPIPNQPLPAKMASGGVEWPRDKRDTLARAAIDALKADPQNQSVELSPDDVHNMLEQNPSYIQLCVLLEQKGFKFHRGHFARQLLSSVPDLTNSVKETPSKFPQGPSPLIQPPPVPAMVPQDYTSMVHGPPPPLPQYSPLMHIQLVNCLYQPPPLKQENGIFPDRKPMKKDTMVPAKPRPPVGSKEAMARKRDFSELVDLTQLSDNDDYVLSSKHPLVASPSPEPDPFHNYELQTNLQGNRVIPPSSFTVGGLQLGVPEKFDPKQQATASVPAPTPTKTILAKPVNKGEALRKSYYNPKTVARDILVAAGRHPIERPLNAHLAGLLGVHVELDSDLSTFDWDAIDPGGPPAPKVDYVDIPAGPPRFALGGRKGIPNKDKDPRLPKSPRPSRPAIASTFDAFKVQVNHVNQPPQDKTELPPSRLRQSQIIGDTSSPAAGHTLRERRASQIVPPAEAPRSSPANTKHSSMEVNPPSKPGAYYPSGKRRGRPAGSKNKPTDFQTLRTVAKPQVEIPIRAPSPVSQPMFKCRWRKCAAELHNLDTLRKHVIKVHIPTEEEQEENGYICWWKKCSHLQLNTDGTITSNHPYVTADEWAEHIDEEHLHTVAMKMGDGPSSIPIGKPQRRIPGFKTIPTTLPAPEKKQIAPLNLSDYLYSPTQTHTRDTLTRIPPNIDTQNLSEARDRYLSDASGRMATPTYTQHNNAHLPADALVLTTANPEDHEIKAQQSWMKAHGHTKVGAKALAEETLRGMEARKKAIGPGIERGGCTLVNEERRSTFVQNPGVRRVVDERY